MTENSRLTSYSVDHQRVELFLAVFAEAGEIRARLHVSVKQVVE